MIRAIFITLAGFLFLAGCLFGAAGHFSWPMAWAVLGIYFVYKAIGLIFHDPELIRERSAPGPGVDRGDIIIATYGYLSLYPVTFAIAGLDAVRFGPTMLIPQFIQVTALLVYVFGYGFATWAFFCNPFFSTFVRIQDDRDHSVVSSGPYTLVRHPGYAGALLAHFALPFALGSVLAVVPAFIGTVFFVVRTSREDRMLQDCLEGYREYQTRVRWRLLPWIW